MEFSRPVAAQKKTQISLSNLQDEIRKRAQSIFDERKRRSISGDDLSDWLKAEKEVKAKYGIA
jgi:hypothetical protein